MRYHFLFAIISDLNRPQVHTTSDNLMSDGSVKCVHSSGPRLSGCTLNPPRIDHMEFAK